MGSGTKIPNLKNLDSPNSTSTEEKMMRYLGFAKSCRKGRLQYRDFSSASEKVVTAGTKIVEYGFKSAFCGAGFVVGGLISTPVAKQVQESEEMAIKHLQHLDVYEAQWKVILKE